jgi:hypothetical protein
MGAAFDAISLGATRTRGYGERLLKDVTAAHFARKPIVNGTVIDCNHPAFVFGHLAIYPRRILEMLGHDPAQAAVSDKYVELFKNGAPCLDDPQGTIYPGMAEITAAYFRNTDAAIAALAKSDDALIGKALPEGSFFPTVGGAVNFLLTAHCMMHFGQISTWRRCVGLGAA